MQQRHTPPEQQPEGDEQDLLTPDLPKEMKPIQTKPRQVGVHPRLTTPYIGHRRREIGGARRWNALIDAMEPPFGAAPQ